VGFSVQKTAGQGQARRQLVSADVKEWREMSGLGQPGKYSIPEITGWAAGQQGKCAEVFHIAPKKAARPLFQVGRAASMLTILARTIGNNNRLP